MSRYHQALTMVIEGQLRVPCKDTGCTAISMEDVKRLAACVPHLYVLHPVTHPQQSSSFYKVYRHATASDLAHVILLQWRIVADQ